MNREKLFDAAIIIAILTALGYLIAYAFMAGMNSYYQLPDVFIDLNINTMTPILVPVYLIIIGVFVIARIIKYLISNSENLKVFTQLQIIKNLQSKWVFKELKSEFNKVIKIIFIMIPLLFFIIIYDVVEYFGESYASDQTGYLVIQKKEGLYVGLTSFKGLLVIAPLDVQKESMTPKFTTIEMKELKDAEVVYFENGLKVEDVKNINDFNK